MKAQSRCHDAETKWHPPSLPDPHFFRDNIYASYVQDPDSVWTKNESQVSIVSIRTGVGPVPSPAPFPPPDSDPDAFLFELVLDPLNGNVPLNQKPFHLSQRISNLHHPLVCSPCSVTMLDRNVRDCGVQGVE